MGTPLQPFAAKGLLARLTQAAETVYGSRRKLATGAAATLALLLGYHVVFGQNGLTAYRAKRHDIRELRMEMGDLQRENDELHGHVNRLTNDPNAIAYEARETLHYARPGEVIYTMPADDKQPPPK
jgi:cell division protein FtsB